MKTRLLFLTPAVIVLVAAAVISLGPLENQSARAPEKSPVTKAQSDRWQTELSNWGRWGNNDQVGTLNLVTEEKRRQAMALAKRGVVVSLEREVELIPKPEESKQDNKPHGIQFYEIRFKTFGEDDPRHNVGFSSDIQEFHVHGTMTHIDALCHDSAKGKFYNGYVLKETFSETKGCTKLGIETIKDGIVTRGVLVDMTRLKAPTRPPGARVQPSDLEAWERQTGLTVSSGDALFVYNPKAKGEPPAGFDLSVMPWMKARGVAVTSDIHGIPADPLVDHRIALAALGMHMLDGLVLENLAETAARLNRWEFMLVVAPIRVPGATGSPLNPLAMF